ncbi:hypothetical protein B0H67DRAFT_553402 [Lasiosphaeris hirsuta]|uniref:Uncharacterized protein n=1 Tax=Lasiosphaeris hirsuta TaxID=260670 RepID=A0AA40AF70_9PEZI|nr:hypothetical protein B0H67DRAFT_553402 [Lasiosphaeris hirsuta]
MGLIDIEEGEDSPSASTSFSVDLVFVHGLREHGLKAWTDAKTGVLWMRDLFPHSQYKARCLVYEYDAERLLAPGGLATESIYDEAVGLINHLNADRELLDAQARPIIFICHEFGGLLVKRALAYSHSRNDVKIDHLRFIFRSTYAILFMSTPHRGFSKEALIMLHGNSHLGPSQFSLSLLEHSETIQEITDQFAPLRKNFHVSNFWEQKKTTHGNTSLYVVERDSAAPLWDDVVRGGINATHSDMVKFGSHQAPGYRLVLATLNKHVKSAPEEIAKRWEQDLEMVRRSREHEADNLLRPGRGTSANSSRPRRSSFQEPYPQSMPAPSQTPVKSTESFESQDSGSDGPSTPFINIHYLVRQRSEYFVGRQQQMVTLKERFGTVRPRSGRKPKIFVIYGLPGSGKTQFCLRYLEENRHRYWGIFWIDCTTEATAEESFATLGQLSGKGVEPGAGQLWLSQTSDPWLLVLDNANDPEMELEKFLPASGNGHVLITSRNPAAQIYNNLGTVRFHGMDPEEAVTMLLQLAYPDKELLCKSLDNRELAKTIASELGYLALALKQAAFTIRRKLLPLERYLKSFLGCRKELLSRPIIRSATDANIIATWELPFTGISSRDTIEYRDAVDILHVLAFMHFASIPLSIFTLCFDGLKTSSYLKIRPLVLVQSSSTQAVEDRILAAARVLYEHSIISISESDGFASEIGKSRRVPKRYFTLHPAIHQWARERLSTNDSQAWLSCTAAILEHSITANMDTSGRGFRRLLLPHIDSCLLQLQNSYGAAKFPQTPEQATYLERFAMVYAEAGRWERAKPLQLRVVEFRLEHFGRAHSATVSAKRSLANTYWNLFHIEKCLEVQHSIWLTQKFFRPSLRDYLCWPVWKPTYLSHMQTLDDLTRCLWLAGKNDLSRQTGERCLAVLTQRLGPDDPLTVSAMFNLARTYLHLGNRNTEALRLLEYTLARREHFFGPNHPDTLMVVNELGVALCAGRQQLDEAEALVRRAWEARKRVLGEEHAYTLWSANDLSKVLVELRRFGEARALLEDVVVVVERTLGKTHVGMAMTKGNLSRACMLSGDWERARGLLTELQKIVAKEHPDAIYLEWGWAFIKLYHDKDLDGAKEHCERVLQTVVGTKVLPVDNARVLDTAEMLLRIYQGESREEDVKNLRKTFPGVGTGKARGPVDFLPLEKLIRRRTQERLAALQG